MTYKERNTKLSDVYFVHLELILCVHVHVISNLQKEEALRCFLDQFISDILRVKLCPELNQQRTVLLHILSCHLGLASNSIGMSEVRNRYELASMGPFMCSCQRSHVMPSRGVKLTHKLSPHPLVQL